MATRRWKVTLVYDADGGKAGVEEEVEVHTAAYAFSEIRGKWDSRMRNDVLVEFHVEPADA